MYNNSYTQCICTKYCISIQDFIHQVYETRRERALLVRVQSVPDPSQHLSVVLQNGFIKIRISLDSYNTEEV